MAPQPGEYTDRGLVKQAGELTASFLALTYEEVRASTLGLTQPRSPGREAKIQTFYAANALSSVAATGFVLSCGSALAAGTYGLLLSTFGS